MKSSAIAAVGMNPMYHQNIFPVFQPKSFISQKNMCKRS